MEGRPIVDPRLTRHRNPAPSWSYTSSTSCAYGAVTGSHCRHLDYSTSRVGVLAYLEPIGVTSLRLRQPRPDAAQFGTLEARVEV